MQSNRCDFARGHRLLKLGCVGLFTAVVVNMAPPAFAQGLFAKGATPNFTAGQALQGKAIYADNCAMCHGNLLDDGEFGPPLKGAAFKAQWGGHSVDELFGYITSKMPPSAPDTLTSRAYAAIEAYLLQANGAQAGNTELKPTAVAQFGPGRGALSAFADGTYKAALARRKALLDGMAPVTDTMLRDPPASDWLVWRRTYQNLSYSPLTQINKANIARLGLAWSLALPASANEITPLVHDGVLFVESGNTVEALDATTGTPLWQYIRHLPDALHNGRSARMKNLAIYQDKLFAPTADGHLIALDAKTGKLIWDHEIISRAQGMHDGEVDGVAYHISGGPLVAHGKVIIGVSLGINTGGGDFIVGLDTRTGKQLWRFHTIARPGQPGGDSWNGAPVNQRYGGGVWTSGSYDPDLNLVYFGTGNTYDVGTLLLPHKRKGKSNDALYTDSTLALDPDTGKLVWYYQHMNRDLWDLDWVFEQSLITLPIDGKPTKLVVTGGKMAIFDAVNRTNGKYAFSKDLGLQNVVASINPRTGHKNIAPEFKPAADRTKFLCPNANGARNWPTTAYDPKTKILYVPIMESCADYTWKPRDAAKTAAGGEDIHFSVRPRKDSDGKYGRIEAVNLETRKVVWTHRFRPAIASSMLATAGGLVFEGAEDRYFRAFDATTGKVLWRNRLNAVPSSSPVTYSVGGQQYIAVVAGGGSPMNAGGMALTPELYNPPGGTTLWVFRLSRR